MLDGFGPSCQATRNTGDMTEKPNTDVYARIKTKATGFGIRPGERINEGALARELGVSRTPVREALNRLVAEQLIEFRPGTGFFCRPLDPGEMFNLYEMRNIVETAAIRLATLRATDSDILAFIEDTEATGMTISGLTIAQAVERDEAFHIEIARLSGNAELLRTLKGINDRIRFIRWVRIGQRIKASKGEHRAILAALQARDPDQAVRDLSRHIVHRKDQVVDAVRAGISSIYLDGADALSTQMVEDV